MYLLLVEEEVICMNIVFETVIDPVTIMLIWALLTRKNLDQ